MSTAACWQTTLVNMYCYAGCLLGYGVGLSIGMQG